MKFSSAILGGFVGAAALTLLHEGVRRVNKDAPRMDLLGMEALEKTLDSVDVEVPNDKELFDITMAGDIISNSLYYSIAGLAGRKKVLPFGIVLGLAAGLGGVYLPKPMGLNSSPSSRTTNTKLMTVIWYLIGGVVSSASMMLIDKIEVDE